MRANRSVSTLAAGLLGVVALGLAVFGPGLHAWFQRDDFVWIWIARRAHTDGLWTALATATPQGTWRPLTDGLLFTVFHRWFGLDAAPYRALVFATYAGNVVLVATLARRLGASVRESLVAAALFAVHDGLAVSMAWTCAYNQLLAITFTVGSLILWRRYCETRRFAVYAWIVSLQLLGVLALETHILFPLEAAAYVLLLEPRTRWRECGLALIPLAAIAATWAVLHVVHAPPPHDGPYKAVIGFGAVATLWHYWVWTVTPAKPLLAAWQHIVAAGAAIASAIFAISRQRRGDARPIFFAALYLILLAPALALPNHVVPNVVALPAVAFALLAAAWFEHVWSTGAAGSLVAAAAALMFTVSMGRAAHGDCAWWTRRSVALRPLFTTMTKLRAANHDARIRVVDVDSEFIETALFDNAFVYLNLAPACAEVSVPEQWKGLPAGVVCPPRRDGELTISATATDRGPARRE